MLWKCELVSPTRSPVDGAEWPEHPEDPEDLQEPDAGAAKDGDQGDGDHHNIQAVERLDKTYIYIGIFGTVRKTMRAMAKTCFLENVVLFRKSKSSKGFFKFKILVFCYKDIKL